MLRADPVPPISPSVRHPLDQGQDLCTRQHGGTSIRGMDRGLRAGILGLVPADVGVQARVRGARPEHHREAMPIVVVVAIHHHHNHQGIVKGELYQTVLLLLRRLAAQFGGVRFYKLLDFALDLFVDLHNFLVARFLLNDGVRDLDEAISQT